MSLKAAFYLLLLGITQLAAGQDTTALVAQAIPGEEVAKEERRSLFELLVRDSIHEISIATNFDSLDFYRIKETYQKAALSFVNAEGKLVEMDFKVRTRGKMRKRVCDYTSLKLKFKKSLLKKMGLLKENKYKMVCQCNGGKKYEQLLFKEYLGYRFYNHLSEDSYETHLFKINYTDTSDGSKQTRYAILLEEEDAFAERRGGRALERPEFDISKISRPHLARISVFQYMIGNTDWSLKFLHNLKIVSEPNGSTIVPIPYDFDYSGLVNAPYAIPNPDFKKLRQVTDRYFMPSGFSAEEIDAVLKVFHEEKDNITQEWENFDLLSKQSRKHIRRFIGSFYKTIESPRQVRKIFVK